VAELTRHNVHQVEIIWTGLDRPECINFGSDGRLYAGDFNGQVHVMTPPKFELRQLTNAKGFL
jgi:outer membrane protein assembly factor BamB